MLEEERDMVFLALGSFTCQVSVIGIKTEATGDIKTGEEPIPTKTSYNLPYIIYCENIVKVE